MGGVRRDKFNQLRSTLEEKNISWILIHSNFLNGNGGKFLALLRYGFWLTKFPDPGCLDYKGIL